MAVTSTAIAVDFDDMGVNELARPLDGKVDEEGSYRLPAGDGWPAGIGHGGILREEICQFSHPVLIDVFVVSAAERPDGLAIVVFGETHLDGPDPCSQLRFVLGIAHGPS